MLLPSQITFTAKVVDAAIAADAIAGGSAVDALAKDVAKLAVGGQDE